MGMQNPPMEVLCADSNDPGQRSKVFTWKYGLVQAGCAIGPLCSLMMFWILGNEWNLEACQYVIVAGMVLVLLSTTLCFRFDDEKAHLTLSPATQAAVRRVASKRRQEIEGGKSRQVLLGEEQSRSRTVLVEGKKEEGEEELMQHHATAGIFRNAFTSRLSWMDGASSALIVPLLQPNEE